MGSESGRTGAEPAAEELLVQREVRFYFSRFDRKCGADVGSHLDVGSGPWWELGRIICHNLSVSFLE